MAQMLLDHYVTEAHAAKDWSEVRRIMIDETSTKKGHLIRKRIPTHRVIHISNYAEPGYECRHNFAVWRGEDYLGLGEGACGRIGLKRTKFGTVDTVTPEFDVKERALFRLRTREGLDLRSLSNLPNYPDISNILAKHVGLGLLTQAGTVYRLADRGMEVCDSVLAELV